MLQVQDIRTHLEDYIAGLSKRGVADASMVLQEVLDTDQRRKDAQQELEQVLAQSNQMAKQIGALMKAGKKEEAENAKTRATEMREQGKVMTDSLHALESNLQTLLYNIPNIPHKLVPVGNDESANVVIKTSTDSLPTLEASAKPHWDLIEEYDIVDFELGNKVSGAGFPFYKGAGARMVRGMINYFLDQAIAKGYIEVQPPIVINEASGYGTGQLPDKEGQMYGIVNSQQFLIPTAEVPITNMYRDTILKEEQLPVKHVGHTPCFRREAGNWGAHVRGLNRLHQFDKVEIVQVSRPEDSYQTLDEMVAHVEKLVDALGLPYRILRLCAGDLGFTSTITYDFEVYSAAQKKWLEVSSVSNFETYQANRLKLRYRNAEGKKHLAHTLNGSALAIPRILAALLENNQTKDGIVIPEVLVPYTGFSKIEK